MAKTKDIIKDMGKDLSKATKYIGSASYNLSCGLVMGITAFPTLYRKHKELERHTPDDEADYLIDSGLLLAAYGMIGYIPLFGYNPNIGFKILAAQVTTNAVSGLYEIYRYKKNKIEEREKNSSLETKLEQIPTQPPQTSQSQKSNYKPLPDPWSIETPEIKSYSRR